MYTTPRINTKITQNLYLPACTQLLFCPFDVKEGATEILYAANCICVTTKSNSNSILQVLHKHSIIRVIN